MMTKRSVPIIISLIAALLVSCNHLPFGSLLKPAETPNPYKAVYLTNGLGELTVADLKAHPEVIVTLKFDDFKSHTGTKIALWIDKNAVSIVDRIWLNQPPQKYYPLVLIGYNSPLYCFRDMLDVGNIQATYIDWSKEKIEPDFSVFMILEEDKNGSESSTLRGYQWTPSVHDILNITNPLLEIKQDIQPTSEKR